MNLKAWKTRGRKKVLITDRNNMTYLEIFGDGRFRMSSDEDIRQNLDLVKKDKIERWEERWARKR